MDIGKNYNTTIKSTLVASILYFLSGCATPPYNFIGNSPLKNVQNSYLSLSCGIPVLFEGSASATIIYNGIAVTNKHVAKFCGDTIAAKMSDGMTFNAHVIAMSDRADLAYLSIPKDIGNVPEFADAKANEKIWAMGTTIGQHPVASGYITTLEGYTFYNGATAAPIEERCGHKGHMIRGIFYEARAGDGYSGGPIVNLEGKIIGITARKFTKVWNSKCEKVTLQQPLLFSHTSKQVLEEAERLIKDIE